MRYTTLIDISEYPAVYRNINVRLLYLHLAIKSGYHDNDRDLYLAGVRTMAAEVGLTLSAVRHAVAVLTRVGLLQKVGSAYQVTKFVLPDKPTPRARTRQQQQQQDAAAAAAAAREEQQAKIDRQLAAQRRAREQERATGKSSFMTYYESLQKAAAAGDEEAARLVVKHKAFYEQECKTMANLTLKKT